MGGNEFIVWFRVSSGGNGFFIVNFVWFWV